LRAALDAHDSRMSVNEPGLDLQEWETRWAEIEEQLAEDPRTALPLACDEIVQLLGLDDRDSAVKQEHSEIESAYQAARDIADRIEQGLDLEAGDIATAVSDLRAIRSALLPAGSQ
jgi:hypothetical protein